MAFFIYGKVDKGLELSELTNDPFHYYLRAWGGFGLKEMKVDFVLFENN